MNNINTLAGLQNIFTDEDILQSMCLQALKPLSVDSYKGEHWHLLNPEMVNSHMYAEPRRGNCKVQVVGTYSICKRLLEFTVTEGMIDYMEQFVLAHSGGLAEFNRAGWERIVKEFNGKLPLEVKALREGTLVNTSIPVMAFKATAEGFAWLAPYFGDCIMRVWKPSSVGTLAVQEKAQLLNMARETCDDEELIQQWLMYALHDFGARALGTSEEAGVSSLGHGINFSGSDNWEGAHHIMQVYNLPVQQCPTVSVVALEHNNILSYGKEHEREFIRASIKKVLLAGRIGSILIDTYNIVELLKFICSDEMKADMIRWYEEGGSTGKVVLRPDSGHPVETPIWVCQELMEAFGYVTNSLGYKMLPQWLGVIQGDSVDPDMLDETHRALKIAKLSVINFVYGQGGYLLSSNHTRDKLSWASKVSVYVDKEGQDVKCCKSPIGTAGKKSKEGYFNVYWDGEYYVKESESFDNGGLLTTIYKDGYCVNQPSWADTKQFAHSEFMRVYG